MKRKTDETPTLESSKVFQMVEDVHRNTVQKSAYIAFEGGAQRLFHDSVPVKRLLSLMMSILF